MKRLLSYKISVAFLFPIILTVFTVLMLITVGDAFSEESKNREKIKKSTEDLLNIASAAASDAFWSYNDITLMELGDRLAEYDEIASVKLIDEEDNVIYENVKKTEPYKETYLNPMGERKIYRKDKLIGKIQLIYTSFYLNQETKEAMIDGFKETIIIIAIIWVIIILASRNITVSIERIAYGVKAFSEGNAQMRIHIKENLEIKKLADRINTMFDIIVESRVKLLESYNTLQKQEEELRITEERFRYAVEGSNDAIWDWNLISSEFFVSMRGVHMVGLSENCNMTLDTWIECIHPSDLEDFKEFLQRFHDTHDNYSQIQFRVVNNMDEIRWLHCKGKGIYNQDSKLIRVSGFFTDVTDRIKSEEAINRLAYHDVLTGLPNRAMLYERLNHLFTTQEEKNSSTALLYMDIDNFKAINDTKGHLVGDKVLVKISQELVKSIDCDAIARIGGDEFVIICKNCDEEGASVVASNIINIVSKPQIINDTEFNISCSIGITMYPKDGTDIDKILMNADNAMYLAKERGKGQYEFYVQSMNDILVKKIEMQNEMRRGILNREFILYYQPKVDIVTGYINGVEALVRWKHPTRGILYPNEFIGIAEESDLIIPLSQVILETACEQSSIWEKEGIKDLSIAVNMSGKQFKKKGMEQDIIQVLEKTGMRPELLVIEITESIALEDVQRTVHLMNSLKERGIKFSLDDFGTGYSSLNYLITLPIDHVKIDKHFIQRINKHNFEEVVVKAVIEIGHSMGLSIVAEGIEEKEQLDALKHLNADQGQGYYYSRPIPKDDINKLLLNRYMI